MGIVHSFADQVPPMIVYNVTIKIDLDIVRDWQGWMLERHIPDVMATGCFVDFRLLRLMEENQMDGFTFAVQYRAESMGQLRTYQKEHAERLQAEHTQRYEGKFVAFRTILREVHAGDA